MNVITKVCTKLKVYILNLCAHLNSVKKSEAENCLIIKVYVAAYVAGYVAALRAEYKKQNIMNT